MDVELEDKGEITVNNEGYFLSKREHGDSIQCFQKKKIFRKSILFGIYWVWFVSDKDIIKKLGT